MTNDILNEILIKKDISPLRWFFDILVIFTSLIIIIASLLFLEVMAVIPVVLLLIVVPWIIGGRWVEYEYVLTNDQLDFDKITAKRRRKNLFSLDVKTMEFMAPMTVDYKQQFFDAKANKTVDLASNPRAPGRWFIVFNSPRLGKVTVVFEPTVKMVRNIYRFAPRKVLGMDYLDEALENGDML